LAGGQECEEQVDEDVLDTGGRSWWQLEQVSRQDAVQSSSESESEADDASSCDQLPSGHRSRLAQVLQGSSAAPQAVDLSEARSAVQQLFEQLRPQLLAPSPFSVFSGNQAAAQAQTAAPAAAAAAADTSAAAGGRRRRRKASVPDSQQPADQQAAAAAADTPAADTAAAAAEAAAAGMAPQQYGVVHELLPNKQPPPAHEGVPVLYMLLSGGRWWYGGETQVRGGDRGRVCVDRKA
jgi:hypothetical protein